MSGNGVDALEVNPTRPSPLLSLSVFRGFNFLPRELLGRTQDQMLGFRIHGPLVLGGEGNTSNGLELRMRVVASGAL